jgi:hypothetical protein
LCFENETAARLLRHDGGAVRSGVRRRLVGISEKDYTMSELATWKCHKIVKAGKITAFTVHHDLIYDRPSGSLAELVTLAVEDVNGVPCLVDVAPFMFARGMPNLGDYIVIYEDGYKSWSPAQAFEEGYARI